MRNVILSILALAAAACAGSTNKEPTSKVYGDASEVREGTVASISEDRMTVVDPSRPDSAAVVLDISSNTTFVEKGDFVDRGAVDEGDAVRVFYDENDDALRVEVLSRADESEQVEEKGEVAPGLRPIRQVADRA